MAATHIITFESRSNLSKSPNGLMVEMRNIIRESSHEELNLVTYTHTSNSISFVFSETDIFISKISSSTLVGFANEFARTGSYFSRIRYEYEKKGFFGSETFSDVIQTGISPPNAPPPPPTGSMPAGGTTPGGGAPTPPVPPPTIVLPPSGIDPVLPGIPPTPIKNHELRIRTLLSVRDSLTAVVRNQLAPFVINRLGAKFELTNVQKTNNNEITIQFLERGNNLIPIPIILAILAKVAIVAGAIITGWLYKENTILQDTAQYQESTISQIETILDDQTLTEEQKEQRLQQLLRERGNPARVIQEGNNSGLFEGVGTAAILLIAAFFIFSKK